MALLLKVTLELANNPFSFLNCNPKQACSKPPNVLLLQEYGETYSSAICYHKQVCIVTDTAYTWFHMCLLFKSFYHHSIKAPVAAVPPITIQHSLCKYFLNCLFIFWCFDKHQKVKCKKCHSSALSESFIPHTMGNEMLHLRKSGVNISRNNSSC